VITIDVVDYGAGNLASVLKAIRVVDAEPRVATTPQSIASSRALLIPGVGHFSTTATLNDDWRNALLTRISNGAALLGICLGMQWLFEGSDEAPDSPGLGLFPGRCFRLQAPGAKVPHVGWNSVDHTSTGSRLLTGVSSGAFAYFTHTFAAPVGPACVAATTHGDRFASVVEQDRVFGAQWHPEKSGDTGLRVLRNFVAIAEGSR
jgi:glutamine amidotransferase